MCSSDLGTPKGNISSDADFVKAMNRNWLENVVEAVKDVSRSASTAKDVIDQSDTSVSGLFIRLWISLSVIFEFRLYHVWNSIYQISLFMNAI